MICDKHGGPWGSDETCTGCMTLDGKTKPWPDPNINPQQWPFFAIPEGHWDCRGTDDDPTDRLGCAIHINNTPMHVEAFAVKLEDERQVWDSPCGEALLDAIDEHTGYPGEPLYTWNIKGRDYVIVLTPFSN